ncbi:hypothetical protein BH10ACT5_BH10ACT5_18820 [soil metagenome]
MNENEQPDPKGVSRRTVTKAMAWAVPVIAVAATVPGAVASPAPPPFFDFLNGSKNPGNSCTTTCIPKQSYGVPVTVTNPQATSLIIQFTDYLVNGSSVGINNVGVVYPGLNCATKVASCPLPAGCTVVDSIPISANNSICVPAGATLTFWVISGDAGSSAQATQNIPWRWIDPTACSVIASGTAFSPTAPPNDFC